MIASRVHRGERAAARASAPPSRACVAPPPSPFIEAPLGARARGSDPAGALRELAQLRGEHERPRGREADATPAGVAMDEAPIRLQQHQLSSYAFAVFFIALQGVNLLPPILVDGVLPLVNLVVAVVTVAVVAVLAGLGRMARIRHLGLRAGLAVRGGGAVLVGALSALLCVLIARHPAVSTTVVGFARGTPGEGRELPASLLVGIIDAVFIFAVWALVVVVPQAVERDRARRVEIAALKLEARQLRAEAELLRLRGQLEPHFLLNTLNLIAGLVGTDAERARSVLSTVGELLRDTLVQHAEMQPIDDEVRWLQRYVEVLEARHGDLLQVTWVIEARARAGLVPRMILQPLVENAIRHGALQREGGGRVAVRARCVSDMLECEVRDDGPGPGATRDGAIGLENVRRRVALCFPTGSLTLEPGSSGGTRAILRVPYTVADATASGDEVSHDRLAG
jgi:signal transduction histidine kinase